MVNACAVHVAVFVFLIAVTVYGDAGNAQAIHNDFISRRESAANGFAFHKTAVRGVDISRRNVLYVVFPFVRAVIVRNIFRKITVQFFGKILVSFRILVGFLLFVHNADDFVDLAFITVDRRRNRFGRIEAVVAVGVGFSAAVDISVPLAALRCDADRQFVKVDIKHFGVIGQISVARRAERSGDRQIAVLRIGADLGFRNDLLFRERVFHQAVRKVARAVHFVESLIELFGELKLLLVPVRVGQRKIIVKIRIIGNLHVCFSAGELQEACAREQRKRISRRNSNRCNPFSC